MCSRYRPFLEQTYDIRFAPEDVAARFSYEFGSPRDSWAYHGVWNVMEFADIETIDYFITRLPYDTIPHHHFGLMIGNLNKRGLSEHSEYARQHYRKNV
jgi:hypothetical protein